MEVVHRQITDLIRVLSFVERCMIPFMRRYLLPVSVHLAEGSTLRPAGSILHRLQEKHVREKLRDHLKSIVSMQTELMEVQKKVKEAEAKITDTHNRQERLLESATRLAYGEPVFSLGSRVLSRWCLSMPHYPQSQCPLCYYLMCTTHW